MMDAAVPPLPPLPPFHVSSNPPIVIQLGLFGGFAEIIGMHLVAAHTRVIGDGTEVFVGEHLRWDRGKQPPRERAKHRMRPAAAPQPSLFDAPRDAASLHVMEEVELFPGAFQLPLWGAG